MKWWPAECKSGDLIRVQIGSVWHYGVFVSEEEIIQFGKPPRGPLIPPAEIMVCSTTIDEFSAGDTVEVAQLSLKEKLQRRSRTNTVQFARSKIGQKGYNLLHNNCEHFAMNCVFGHAVSLQAESALKIRADS